MAELSPLTGAGSSSVTDPPEHRQSPQRWAVQHSYPTITQDKLQTSYMILQLSFSCPSASSSTSVSCRHLQAVTPKLSYESAPNVAEGFTGL